MSETNSNNIIAKNTFVLYLRMMFILCVGLFTSRVVLNALGVVDYGLYNVVGGFVSFFAFLNGAMSTATQRFVTFELAGGNIKRQQDTFSTAILIHLALALLIVFFAETIGLWFIYNKLVIPEHRFSAALWVYQLSIASIFVSIISIPYNALVIAHEKMSAFAYISILEMVLKLIIVYLLTIVTCDKLILYSVLLFMVGLLNRIIYGVYCSRHFVELNFSLHFDKRLFKEMCNIAGWSLFGNIAGILYTQGINILLNMFFGPAVNAARGIAVTVQGVVTGFVSNFQMALNPQITKSYATDNYIRMHNLIIMSSKFSFFLLFVIVLPIILETNVILTIWLKIVPKYTVWFLRLILCVMLIDTLANPLMVASQAVGRVKLYQSVVGGTLLLILPFAYLFLKLGFEPESVFVVHLFIAIFAQLFRIIIVSRMIRLSMKMYLKEVIKPIFLVSFFSVIFPIILCLQLPDSLLNSLFVILSAFLCVFISVFLLGLSSNEQQIMIFRINLLKAKFKV